MYGPWVSSPLEGLKLLDSGVRYAREFAELSLGESSLPAVHSKTRQRGASGSLDHPYSPCVVGSSFTNEVRKQAEEAHNSQSTRKQLPEGISITPRRVPAQYLSLDAAERDLLLQDHLHQRTKLLIELSRVALMRTFHE
jgi:hypothetical protein